MDLLLRTGSSEQTQQVGAALAPLLLAHDVLVLTGDLGAGKTTLTRGIAHGLGATEHVQSPTFTLVREYLTGRLPVAHVDVYRLSRVQDVVDLALEELDGGHEGVLLVEWGDAVEDLLAGEHLRVTLTARDPVDVDRRIVLSATDAAWTDRWNDLGVALDRWVMRG